MCHGGTLQSTECHPCTLVAECRPGTSDSLRNFMSVVCKVSSQDFLPFLGAPRPKISNRSFWSACDQMVLLTGVWPKPGFGPFVMRLWVKFSKFWPGETSNLYTNSLESFPPRFFTYFGRPTTKNYESVFLTIVRPAGAFDQRATKTRVRSFWPSCNYFPISVLLTNGATNGGLKTKTTFHYELSYSFCKIR